MYFRPEPGFPAVPVPLLHNEINSPNDEVDGHGDEAVEEVVAVGEEAGNELPSRPEAVEGKK